MKTFKYIAVLILYSLLLVLDFLFIVSTVGIALDKKDAGAVVVCVVFSAFFIFMTVICRSYSKRLDKVHEETSKVTKTDKHAELKHIDNLADDDDDAEDEPIWVSEGKKNCVKQIQKLKGEKTVNDFKMTVTLSGDSGSDYKADIEIKNSMLFIQCSCPAGMSSTRCKHALSLVNGDFSRLKIVEEKDRVSKLFGSLKIEPKDTLLKNELENIEKQEKELKERKKALKKQMDRLFFEGIPVE